MKEELEKIFANKNYFAVFEELQKFAKTDDFMERRKIQNKLFIKYLQIRGNVDNLYEKVAIRMSTIVYTDEVLKFLLENNLDLDYKGEDIFKTPLVLKYYLATNIKSTKLMQLFLTKVKDNNKIYFGNNNYRTYTDLCRMNIIALNINKALEVFNDDIYKLLNVDYLDSQKLIDSLTNENNFYPNSLGFGGHNSSILFKKFA